MRSKIAAALGHKVDFPEPIAPGYYKCESCNREFRIKIGWKTDSELNKQYTIKIVRPKALSGAVSIGDQIVSLLNMNEVVLGYIVCSTGLELNTPSNADYSRFLRGIEGYMCSRLIAFK